MVWGAYKMLDEARELFGILEAPLADIQALHFAADKLFWVKGWVPWFDQQRAKHHLEDIWCRGLVVAIGRGTHGCAILHEHIYGHWEMPRGWRNDAFGSWRLASTLVPTRLHVSKSFTHARLTGFHSLAAPMFIVQSFHCSRTVQ